MFRWDRVGDVVGWFGYRRRPGEVMSVCIGVFAEAEVIVRLAEHDHVLDQDDRIDLGVWLNRGGLEEMVRAPLRLKPPNIDWELST